ARQGRLASTPRMTRKPARAKTPFLFPKGFLWGAATSAYQVEGSPLADGAAPSNWHRFSHTPGLVDGGDTGDVACDHYRRFREDVKWMAQLGLTAYRFSVSWSRILPRGAGKANPRGLAFYDRLVDALLEREIQPFVTIFHWDLPAALEDRGGWLNPDIADRVAARRSEIYMNRQYLDPVFRGRYPEDFPSLFGETWPIPEPDLSGVSERIDFLGVNYYKRGVMRHDPTCWPFSEAPVRPRGVHTATGWEVYPAGLTEALLWVRRRYGDLPLYVTENGAAFPDPARAEDLVPDSPRLRYLREHLRPAYRAIEAGVDLRGYFVWSLLDNFEWSHGYSKRFGIVHVDYSTQKRTPKASAWF